MDRAELKLKIHQKCLYLALTKIDSLKSELVGLQEASNQDTKSSAGDKYETGRSMIVLEKEKLGIQLMAAYKLKKALDLINLGKSINKVGLGALVKESNNFYYFSANFGVLDIADVKVFALSTLSPIGQAMLGKTPGSSYTFRGTQCLIETVH
ncbi:MAG: 3-oxoacyl-ACP synthase [Cyclobacteriaceae bacterium]|nr:3-oxoacyl-ACP synthase [Cyclobacteriaceae bacterium]